MFKFFLLFLHAFQSDIFFALLVTNYVFPNMMRFFWQIIPVYFLYTVDKEMLS